MAARTIQTTQYQVSSHDRRPSEELFLTDQQVVKVPRVEERDRAADHGRGGDPDSSILSQIFSSILANHMLAAWTGFGQGEQRFRHTSVGTLHVVTGFVQGIVYWWTDWTYRSNIFTNTCTPQRTSNLLSLQICDLSWKGGELSLTLTWHVMNPHRTQSPTK